MARITKEVAINALGKAAVDAVINTDCDFTDRVTDGTAWHGYTEFSAAYEAIDQFGDKVTLIAYWFQEAEEAAQVESLDLLNWGEPDNYEIL